MEKNEVGSRGTWTAAVSGVAAAIAATDMVVRGQCVNAFCIVRPPGHHAGRTLHPMRAVRMDFAF
jgi:acetoin utilization deacetylase AcuC-like enzyme